MNGNQFACATLLLSYALLATGTTAESTEIEGLGEHGYADSDGVKIHYVTKGNGPLLVMIHGLKDAALLPGGLNDTWQWLEKDLTLVTVPGAGHFVQQDAAEFVTKQINNWLTR